MKEIVRLLVYGTGSLAVIWLLVALASHGAFSGYELLPLALLLVVVAPLLVLGLLMRRERTRAKGQDAGKP